MLTDEPNGQLNIDTNRQIRHTYNKRENRKMRITVIVIIIIIIIIIISVNSG
jgi:t-SNARE complex subunit (syntaxin)